MPLSYRPQHRRLVGLGRACLLLRLLVREVPRRWMVTETPLIYINACLMVETGPGVALVSVNRRACGASGSVARGASRSCRFVSASRQSTRVIWRAVVRGHAEDHAAHQTRRARTGVRVPGASAPVSLLAPSARCP